MSKKFPKEVFKEHRDALLKMNKYDKYDAVRQILADVRKHKVYNFDDHMRAVNARELFSNLELPEDLVVAELGKSGTPFEKFQLIELLRGHSDPSAIQALLRQMDDKRIVDEGFPMEGRRDYLRVCDFAIQIISVNLVGNGDVIQRSSSDESREKAIAETLHELNLKISDPTK
jgi:hypothetical protein